MRIMINDEDYIQLYKQIKKITAFIKNRYIYEGRFRFIYTLIHR